MGKKAVRKRKRRGSAAEFTGKRIPVICGDKVRNDRNRRLMLKFKYGTITDSELDEFHELVKNIIYKAMHRNPTMVSFEDLYHDIWLKIVRFRGTWNQNKNTFVSTWITIVANSVINTARKKYNRRNATEWLYEDIRSGCEDDDDDGGNPTAADFLAFDGKPISEFGKDNWWDMYSEVKSSLDEDDLAFLEKVEEYSSDLALASPRRRRKITRKIASELGWKESYAVARMNSIQSIFSKRMGDGET